MLTEKIRKNCQKFITLVNRIIELFLSPSMVSISFLLSYIKTTAYQVKHLHSYITVLSFNY